MIAAIPATVNFPALAAGGPYISTHDLCVLETALCLYAALLLVELMLATASRLNSAPAERMLWPCLPLPHGDALLVAQLARVGMPTRRVVECRAHEGSASAWRQALLCNLWGRLGVGRVCASVPPGVSFRDRQARPSQRSRAGSTGRTYDG